MRYISNDSSGIQGTSIANALIRKGAEVIFVTGKSTYEKPLGAKIINVESAREMYDAVFKNGPYNVAICAAAVSDWYVDNKNSKKIKKSFLKSPQISLKENPDILSDISKSKNRPELVIGFAAETDDLIKNAKSKLNQKGCDIIVANKIDNKSSVFGNLENKVSIISNDERSEGSEINVIDGIFSDVIPAPKIDGTQITIRDLFYNTPARKKFLKTPRTEARKIIETVKRFGLSCPDLGISLVTDGKKIIDLPGFGYAKASKQDQNAWAKLILSYLEKRAALTDLILIMDMRHPFQNKDLEFLSLCKSFNLPIHLVLTKADKLNNKETQNTLKVVSEKMADYPTIVDSLVFSATKKIGLETLLNKIKLLLEV